MGLCGSTAAAAALALPMRLPATFPADSKTYTTAYIVDRFTVPDWFPKIRSMPRPVRQGRKPDAYACGYCHLPTALGRPENAESRRSSQGVHYRAGQRFQERIAPQLGSPHGSITHMILAAKAVTPEEVEAAADYFSKLKLH